MKKHSRHLDKVKRARRMIEIYLMLRHAPANIEALATIFEVNARSIQRDLKLLKEAGAHIVKETWGYYVDKKNDSWGPKRK
jgi:predicted DNA-binding transcriptional regulator YafY